jgi:UDP-2,3-diacylglucosamine pyrophosphatase LpxH
MPDGATLRAVEYIKNEPMIKALIVGHTHLNFEENLTKTLPQYATHGSFAGYVREFTVV